MPARKPTRRPAPSRHEHADYRHSHEHPSCRLLSDAALQVTAPLLHEPTSALPPLLMDAMLQRSKKKRKKKKKAPTNPRYEFLQVFLHQLRQQPHLLLPNMLPAERFWDRWASRECIVEESAIVSAISAIVCDACRQQCLALLESDRYESRLERILAVEEDPYDYQRLEEGLSMPTLMFVRDAHRRSWRLERSSGEVEPGDVVDMMQDYLLGRGLTQESMLETILGDEVPDLSDNIVQSIHQTVASRRQLHQQELVEAGEQLEKLQGKLSLTEFHATRNIEMKAYPEMMQVDDDCCAIMERLARLLTAMTRSYWAGLRPPSERLPYAARLDEPVGHNVRILWSIYLAGVESMMQEMTRYEQGLMGMADRHGVFPQVFFSHTYREIYREMVAGKLKATRKTLDALQNRLHADVDTGLFDDVGGATTLFLTKLVTNQVFVEVVNGANHVPHQSMDRPEDYAVDDLVTVVRECLETVRKGSIDGVREEHERRRQRILRMLETVWDRLSETSSVVRAKDESWTDTMGTVRAQVTQVMDPSGDHVDPLEIYRAGLTASTGLVIELWLDLRHKYRMLEDLPPMVMPLSVMKTMTDGYGTEHHHHHAGNVQNRFTCILVGLYYRWMAEISDEIKAEIAEQELLTSMAEADESPVVVVAAAAASTSKKKKSKKKKKGDKATENVTPTNAERPESTSSGVQKAPRVADTDSEQEDKADKTTPPAEDVQKPATTMATVPSITTDDLDAAVDGWSDAVSKKKSKKNGRKQQTTQVEPAVAPIAPVEKPMPKAMAAELDLSAAATPAVHVTKPAAKAKERISKTLPAATPLAVTMPVVTKTKKSEATPGGKPAKMTDNGKQGPEALTDATKKPNNDSKKKQKSKKQNGKAASAPATDTDTQLSVATPAPSPEAIKEQMSLPEAAKQEETKRAAITKNGNHAEAASNPPTAPIDDDAEFEVEDIDAFISVGVHDRDNFITAEDFLVGRLLAVLNELK